MTTSPPSLGGPGHRHRARTAGVVRGQESPAAVASTCLACLPPGQLPGVGREARLLLGRAASHRAPRKSPGWGLSPRGQEVQGAHPGAGSSLGKNSGLGCKQQEGVRRDSRSWGGEGELGGQRQGARGKHSPVQHLPLLQPSCGCDPGPHTCVWWTFGACR